MIKLSVQIGLTALLLFVAMAPTVDSFQTAIPPRVCQIAYKETGINFCGTEPRIKDAKGNLKYPGQVCSAYDTHQVDLWVKKITRKGKKNKFAKKVAKKKVGGDAVVLRGKARQSSTSHGGAAKRAIDGDTSQNYRQRSCTHTKRDGMRKVCRTRCLKKGAKLPRGWTKSPGKCGRRKTRRCARRGRSCVKMCKMRKSRKRAWWQLSLKKKTYIEKVEVWNRKDCCSNRLEGVKVMVDRKKCGTLSGNKNMQTVTCQKEGKKIKLVHTRPDYLTLCEVKVFGDGSQQDPDEKPAEVYKKKYMCDTRGADQVFFSCESASLEGRIWKVLKQCFLSKNLNQQSRCPLEDILGGKMLTDCCSACEKAKLKSLQTGNGPYTAGDEAFFDWRVRTSYPSSEENENCYAEFASAEGIRKNRRSFGPVQNQRGKTWASALFQNCGEEFSYCESEAGLVKRYKHLQKVIYPCVAKGLFPQGPGKDKTGMMAAKVIAALKKRFPPSEDDEVSLLSADPLLSDIENVKMEEDALISTRQGWSFGSSSCGAV